MAKELTSAHIAAMAAAMAAFPDTADSQANSGVAMTDVLTTVTAAEYLQVSVEVVTAEAEAGRLPGRKLGGEWRFLKLAIDEWLANPAALEPGTKTITRSKAGAGETFTDDPEQIIETIYAERKKHPVRG